MEAQIIQYIQQILQREPLPGEVESWVALVDNGPMTLDGVQNAIINSAEAVNDVYPVIRAYQAVYGRVPDDGGLDYWVNVYRGVQDLDNPETPTVNEGTLALLEAWVDPAQTPEFAERFGVNPTGMQFVTACYVNVLNREPDQPGLAYWEDRYNALRAELVSGGMSEEDASLKTRQIILEQFVNAQEYIDRSEYFVETFLAGAGDGTEDYIGSLWDRAPFELSTADVSIVEGDVGTKVVTIDVELDVAPTKDVVLNYTTVAGTATAGDDYIPQTGQITILAGQTKASVQITIIGDVTPEFDETFDVVFSSPLIVGGSVASTVTIQDDESTAIALTSGIDSFVGPKAGGPGNEVYLSSDDELGANDRIDGGGGEDTLFHMVNRASDFAANAGWTQPWSIADDLQSGGNGLARGMSVVWSGFQTENVEVLAIQNNDEWFFGIGSGWGQDEGPYGAGSFDYGDYSAGGFAMVDVTGMKGLETVVFYQQNGNTGVRDLQPSHIAHDGVHVALIDIEGFHGADGGYGYESGGNEIPNEYKILEDDNPWTCADESGLPRQIAATVDTIIDFDTEATRGENAINVLLNEVSMANLWFTQNLDNRDGELAEIEQLNLILPNEVNLKGDQFDGITGEPALINRIWASSKLHTITVTGDDVTELVNGGPDSEYDLMLGIPILATYDWYTAGADVGDPWGLDVGLPGLTLFDASEFDGDLFLALYNAVNMTVLGGAGDDDIFINAEDADVGYLGVHADNVGLLQGTTIDGGEGHNVLWLPMSDNHGYDPNSEGERGFDAVGPGNTLVNIDHIVFYGAIGHGSNTYELNVDWLGLDDPSRTELVFDGAIGASTVIFDNFDEVINVKFTDIGGFLRGDGEEPIYAPTLAFVPAGEGDNDTVNITFADDTRSSTFVTITDDEQHGPAGDDIKGGNNESDDEWDGDFTDDVDHEVEILNIHLEDSDCGIADCLHIGIDSMVDLREIRITDDDYLRTVTPAMALFFSFLASQAAHAGPPQAPVNGFSSEAVQGLPNGLSEEDFCFFMEYFGLDEWNQANGNGVPLPEKFAELKAGDTFVLPQSLAIGTVNNDGQDTPSLALFDASESSANIDMWLNGSVGDGATGYDDGIGYPLYQLDFDPNSAIILTGSGNDRVIDGSGDDTIETGEGCDLILALNGGDDEIHAGGGNDLVVGGAGSDTIYGGDGADMISGDGFGWLLALLVDDECCIDCGPIIWLLDFLCCIENDCFKDEFKAEISWRGEPGTGPGNGEGEGQDTAPLMNGHGGHGGTAYSLITPAGEPGCDATAALWEYFQGQLEEGEDLGSNQGLTLDLCDLAEALRTGEIDLTPLSGSITLEFDCADPAVRDFILQVLEAPLQSLGLMPELLSGDENLADVLANIGNYVDNIAFPSGDDFIDGGAGDDIIHGGSGNDELYGGEGNDLVIGGDGSDIVDGGAGADMMIGGFYIHQPGIPQEVIEGSAPTPDIWQIRGLDGGEADTFTVDLRFDANDDGIFDDTLAELVTVTYTVTVGQSASDIAAGLATALQTASDGAFDPGVISFSSGTSGGLGFVQAIGPAGPNNGDSAQEIRLELEPDPVDNSVSVTAHTIAMPALTGADGDSVSITWDGGGGAHTTTVNVLLNATTGAELAADMAAALATAGADAFFKIEVSGLNVILTPLTTAISSAASVSAVVNNTPGQGSSTWHERPISFTNLDNGDTLTITLDDGGRVPLGTTSFAAVVTGATVEDRLQSFIDQKGDDIADALNGAGNGARVIIRGSGDSAQLVLVDDIEEVTQGYELGLVPGHTILDTVTASVSPAGNAVVGNLLTNPAGNGALAPGLSGSLITGDVVNGPLSVVTTSADINENGPSGYVVELADSVDGVADIIIPAVPAGEDGSDLFVAQTDGVLANSWYSQMYGGEHVVNQLDHICDFWSSQSPDVVAGPEVADTLAFRDASGNVVTFGPGSGWYYEDHNAASTYEDALQTANSQMANGVTKVVALSYDLGYDDNCDTVFDRDEQGGQENFLVVFADTDGDNIADTAVRLLGRDNVLTDFHHQDVVFTV